MLKCNKHLDIEENTTIICGEAVDSVDKSLLFTHLVPKQKK